MATTSVKTKLLRASAMAAALCAIASVGAFAGSPAGADPKQLAADVKVGVGSDTTQDIANAYAGFSNGTNFTPLQGAATQTQLISYDATGSPCITAKINGPSFNRPNGSSAGQRALSRALDGTGYGNATCGGPRNIAGQVNFARSSSLDGTVGNTLTYIPFARDALSFAYYRADGSPVTDLTRAELTTIFSTPGGAVIDGVRILGCGIQTSSGTYAVWNTTVGVSAGQEDSATSECNNLINPATSAAFGRAQESEGPALVARGNAADAASDGTQVVIGFSAAAFIAKTNGLGTPNPGAALLGSISDDGAGNNIGAPVTGTTPNQTFYDNAVFGRTVYNVVSRALINSAGNTNLDLKGLFSGASSQVCTAAATRALFGFTPVANCGSLALERGYRSGQL